LIVASVYGSSQQEILRSLAQHNDRFISKAKPCLVEAICYGAPSISYVNASAASDPIPISEVSTPSFSLVLPSLGG